MPKRVDREFLKDMIVACDKIMKYTSNLNYNDFVENEEKVDAVVRNIEILGEAAKNISDELKKEYPEIEWSAIARTRDKIIHFYFGVDTEIIWDIVTIDIPRLRKQLEEIVRKKGWG